LWRAAVQAGQLVRAWPGVAFDRDSVWLVYPHARRNAAKVRAFRDWLLDEIAVDAATDADGQFTPH
jgi:LysR family glycine cleavage system transcriptional activator